MKKKLNPTRELPVVSAVKSVANAVRKQMDIRQMLLPCLT